MCNAAGTALRPMLDSLSPEPTDSPVHVLTDLFVHMLPSECNVKAPQ